MKDRLSVVFVQCIALIVVFAVEVRSQEAALPLATFFQNFESNKVLLEKRIIVIGELHGTNEVPKLVGALAEAIKNCGRNVTVALEINENYQSAIDHYLKSGDEEILRGLPFFSGRGDKDGRSSIAMADLIKRIRAIGLIRIVCFDLEVSKFAAATNQQRDSAMAVNIKKNIDGNHVIVLTGNIHARITKGLGSNQQFSPMSHILVNDAGLSTEVLSLNTIFAAGKAWYCSQDGCREGSAAAKPDRIEALRLKYNAENILVIKDGSDPKAYPEAYHGFIFLSDATASRPYME